MEQIQMVDLRRQYHNIKDEIDSAIQETIDSTAFINGQAVTDFKKELSAYMGAKHVITCANGTDALQIAMMALGLEPGDEVITSNFTFIATVEVIGLLRLKPVLVDVDPNTFNIDPDKVREAITNKTRAIVPVHLFGQAANIEELMKIGREHNIPIVEDTAQATGTQFTFSNGTSRRVGTIGQIGATSFFPSKNLGCFGDGGALFTDDSDLAGKMQMLVNHGSKVKYYHELVGVNSRLDTLQASILRVKLRYLDEYNKARQQAADYYDKKLKSNPNLLIPARAGNSDHIFHQYTLRILNGKRDEIKEKLAARGVPSMVYYPVPLSLQNAFKSAGYRLGDFPATEGLCSEVLSLPMHTELSTEQLEFICDTLLNII